jgi:hypothetical protein
MDHAAGRGEREGTEAIKRKMDNERRKRNIRRSARKNSYEK